MESNNNVYMIVGATGGIGSEVVRKLDKENAKFILFSRNEEKLFNLKESIKSESVTVKGDATKYSDLERAAKIGIEKFGTINYLIHSVGSIILKPIHKIDEETFRNTIDQNLISAFLSIKSVIEYMISNKKGNVVVISSVAGSKGLMNHEAISAAKGGLESMIRSAAVSYAKKGIRFNGVALGLVDTNLSKFITDNPLSRKASEALHPIGRIGKPADVVNAILYLASEDSSWVTGEILHVDGGMNAG